MKIQFKLYSISLLLSLCSLSSLKAQENIDYIENWNLKQTYEYLLKNRVWIKEGIKDNFSFLELDGKYEKGNWMEAQDANQIRQLTFKTEGKHDLGNFSVWGNFQYSRTMEDSVQLRHQSRINPDAPLYFGSLRKNYYERDLYKINGVVRYDFADGAMPLAVDFDYRVGNHFSNNDPRARIADYQFNTKFFVGRKFNQFDIYLSGLYGYGRERVGVGYKNDQHMNNTSDPLYVNWLMNGFGRTNQQIRDMNYNDDMDRYGISLLASTSINPHHKLNGKVEYIKETQLFKFFDSSPETFTRLNKYNRQSISADILWNTTFTNPNRNSSFRLQLENIQGDDFNYSISSNNYVYLENKAILETVQGWNKWQAKAAITYLQRDSEDGSMGINLAYTHVLPSLNLGYTFDLAEKHRLQPSIGFSYRQVLNELFKYPAISPGIFTDVIMLKNYNFFSTAASQFSFALDYQFRKSSSTAFHIGFHSDYYKRAAQNTANPYYQFIGKDRLNSRLTFSVYF